MPIRSPAKRGRDDWSISPAFGAARKTSGGIPIGFDDDTAYLGRLERILANRLLVVPASVARLADMENFRYCTLLHLLGAEDLSLISVWSPTFLLALLEPLEEWGDQIWPRLALISCWTDAAAARYVDQVRALFPSVEIQPKGLLATEGCVSFPLVGKPGSALALRQQFPLASSRSGLFCNRPLRDKFFLWVANHRGENRWFGELGRGRTSRADRQGASAAVWGCFAPADSS